MQYVEGTAATLPRLLYSKIIRPVLTQVNLEYGHKTDSEMKTNVFISLVNHLMCWKSNVHSCISFSSDEK